MFHWKGLGLQPATQQLICWDIALKWVSFYPAFSLPLGACLYVLWAQAKPQTVGVKDNKEQDLVKWEIAVEGC